MTQSVTGPDGVEHQFPDDTSDDVIKNVMRKTYGAPNGGAWDTLKGYLPDFDPGAAAKAVGRAGARFLLGGDDLLTSGMKALGKEFDRTGLTAPQPTLLDSDQKTVIGGADAPSPSEQFISDTGMQMDPNAGKAMQAFDFAAPILASAGRSAIGSSPTVVGTLVNAAKGAGVQGAEAVGGGLAGEGVKMVGGDDLAQLITQLTVGGGGRAALQAGGTSKIANATRSPDAPAIQTAADELNKTRGDADPIDLTYGMLANNRGKLVEKNMESNPFAGGGVTRARNAVYEGLDNRVSQEAGDVGYAGDPLNQARSADVTGGDLIRSSQRQMTDSDAQDDARQSGLMADIGRLTDTNVENVFKTGYGIAGDPGTDPLTGSAPVLQRMGSLETLANRQNPKPPAMTDAEAAEYFRGRNSEGPMWDAFLAGEPVEAPFERPDTVAYEGAKNWRRALGRSIAGSDDLDSAYKGQLYGQVTDSMRNTAEGAGAGGRFDTVNEATRQMNQEQFPSLERFGGQMGGVRNGVQEFDKTPNPGDANSRFADAAAVGGDSPLMQQASQTLPGDSLARALADVVRRSGTKDNRFQPQNFGKDWRQVNQPARDTMSTFASGAPTNLDNVAKLSDAFHLPPNPAGLTQSMGFQAALAQMPGGILTKSAVTAALLKGLESRTMLKEMANKGGGVAELLSQYARSQPAIQQTIQRAVGP